MKLYIGMTLVGFLLFSVVGFDVMGWDYFKFIGLIGGALLFAFGLGLAIAEKLK